MHVTQHTRAQEAAVQAMRAEECAQHSRPKEPLKQHCPPKREFNECAKNGNSVERSQVNTERGAAQIATKSGTVHNEGGGGYLKCPHLSTRGGEGVKIG